MAGWRVPTNIGGVERAPCCRGGLSPLEPFGPAVAARGAVTTSLVMLLVGLYVIQQARNHETGP